MSYVLAQQGGAEALAVVITLQDIWRGLTKVQRAVLLNPGRPAKPTTISALRRKGLWGYAEITDLGCAVVQYRPVVTR